MRNKMVNFDTLQDKIELFCDATSIKRESELTSGPARVNRPQEHASRNW